MKLHEFTDRFYAMGGIEQEGKRRILTEGDTSGWGSYETQHPVVAKCKIEPYKNWYISNLDDVDPDDPDIFTRDIEQAYVFTSDYWENELQEILDEYTDGYITDDFVPIWYDSRFEPYLDKNRRNESLTEARNPENDEVNAVIRKWANSSRNRLSKRDQKILADNGISLEDMTGEYQKKELSGPGRSTGVSGSYPQVLSKEEVKSYHPDADLLGVLSKDRDREEVEYDYPDYKHGDHRMTDSDKSHWLTSGKTKKGAKVKMPTKSQMDALQPYRKEKDELKRAKKEYEKQRERIKDRAEYKRWKKKNESLNLNESKQGLIDHLYDMIHYIGMSSNDVFELLLGFMDESKLLEVIEELKLMYDIDDEDIMS